MVAMVCIYLSLPGSPFSQPCGVLVWSRVTVVGVRSSSCSNTPIANVMTVRVSESWGKERGRRHGEQRERGREIQTVGPGRGWGRGGLAGTGVGGLGGVRG